MWLMEELMGRESLRSLGGEDTTASEVKCKYSSCKSCQGNEATLGSYLASRH